MAKKFKLKDREVDWEKLKISARMTTTQRLKWLEETRDFFISATPKTTLRAVLKLRENNTF